MAHVPKKHVETLDDGQLRALLDEAITYKCPKDREGKSSLFKELLEEVEQDEQACEAAARGSTSRARRQGRGRRALPHSNSLQDLVAALAAEPAPRRVRHQHQQSHAPVSARAIHGGSLPSGVDTSFLLGEEPPRAGYLATVRCVNPPPLAERRVSASDANCPAEVELLNRRSKPAFPMTYTARATLEIGSGSVCSGRALTTTTSSNQVRTRARLDVITSHASNTPRYGYGHRPRNLDDRPHITYRTGVRRGAPMTDRVYDYTRYSMFGDDSSGESARDDVAHRSLDSRYRDSINPEFYRRSDGTMDSDRYRRDHIRAFDGTYQDRMMGFDYYDDDSRYAPVTIGPPERLYSKPKLFGSKRIWKPGKFIPKDPTRHFKDMPEKPTPKSGTGVKDNAAQKPKDNSKNKKFKTAVKKSNKTKKPEPQEKDVVVSSVSKVKENLPDVQEKKTDPNQLKLLRALMICDSDDEITGGGVSDDCKTNETCIDSVLPRGPREEPNKEVIQEKVPKDEVIVEKVECDNTNLSAQSQIWMKNVNSWYDSLNSFRNPFSQQLKYSQANEGNDMNENPSVNICQNISNRNIASGQVVYNEIIPSTSSSIPFPFVNPSHMQRKYKNNIENKADIPYLHDNYSYSRFRQNEVHEYTGDLCDNSYDMNDSDLYNLRKEYRERVGRFNTPSVSSNNPTNIRKMTIGKPLNIKNYENPKRSYNDKPHKRNSDGKSSDRRSDDNKPNKKSKDKSDKDGSDPKSNNDKSDRNSDDDKSDKDEPNPKSHDDKSDENSDDDKPDKPDGDGSNPKSNDDKSDRNSDNDKPDGDGSNPKSNDDKSDRNSDNDKPDRDGSNPKSNDDKSDRNSDNDKPDRDGSNPKSNDDKSDRNSDNDKPDGDGSNPKSNDDKSDRNSDNDKPDRDGSNPKSNDDKSDRNSDNDKPDGDGSNPKSNDDKSDRNSDNDKPDGDGSNPKSNDDKSDRNSDNDKPDGDGSNPKSNDDKSDLNSDNGKPDKRSDKEGSNKTYNDNKSNRNPEDDAPDRSSDDDNSGKIPDEHKSNQNTGEDQSEQTSNQNIDDVKNKFNAKKSICDITKDNITNCCEEKSVQISDEDSGDYNSVEDKSKRDIKDCASYGNQAIDVCSFDIDEDKRNLNPDADKCNRSLDEDSCHGNLGDVKTNNNSFESQPNIKCNNVKYNSNSVEKLDEDQPNSHSEVKFIHEVVQDKDMADFNSDSEKSNVTTNNYIRSSVEDKCNGNSEDELFRRSRNEADPEQNYYEDQPKRSTEEYNDTLLVEDQKLGSNENKAILITDEDNSEPKSDNDKVVYITDDNERDRKSDGNPELKSYDDTPNLNCNKVTETKIIETISSESQIALKLKEIVNEKNSQIILAELPNNAYMFLTYPKSFINPHSNHVISQIAACTEDSAEKRNEVQTLNKNAFKTLLFRSLFRSDSEKSVDKTAVKEVDSAIPFSCITTPEVVASCNTTSSTSQAAVAVDPKPLQLVSSYRAVANLVGAPCDLDGTSARLDLEQPRSVISSSFNGLPLSRPNYGSTASSAPDEYKKSLDENGNSVQGFSSPLSGSSQHKKPRRKKSSKNETVIKSHQIDGYQGNKDLNEVLRFIESNADNGRAQKLGRAKHKDDSDDKGKKRSTERRKDKESKIKRATSMEELSRTKLEDLTDKPAKKERGDTSKAERRSWGDDARESFYYETGDMPADADFQTVTKKRKPRRRADDPSDPPPARAPSPRARRVSAPPSDRSNDSNDDLDSVHSLPAAPPPAAPAPAAPASYADIARTRHNIPDLIESCNYYPEGAEPPAAPRADADADGYPALEPRAAPRRIARDKPAPPPDPALCITHHKERPESAVAAEGPAPDVVADRRPPVILLDSTQPRDMDGITFGFDINEQLLGGTSRRPRCDLVRSALEGSAGGDGAGAAGAGGGAGAGGAVPAGCGLRYVPPCAAPDTHHLHLIVDYVTAAWEDVVRCGGGKVRYYSE